VEVARLSKTSFEYIYLELTDKKNIFSLLKYIMTRYSKTGSGKYVVQGKNYEILCGSRAQVWHGTAYKTSGGLTKNNLMQNKQVVLFQKINI